MTNREILEYCGYDPDDYVLFENPSFDGAIVGVSTNDRVVYDYDLMVMRAMEQEGWTQEEAIDWIEYNTIRSLSYVENAPVILYPFDHK